MSAVESALDVLSRAATMVQEERPKVSTSLHRKPSSAWRRERRRDPIQSEALDMSNAGGSSSLSATAAITLTNTTRVHNSRPSVIVPVTNVAPQPVPGLHSPSSNGGGSASGVSAELLAATSTDNTAVTPTASVTSLTTPSTNPLASTAVSRGQRNTGLRSTSIASDPAIDEHFKRSLGLKEYAAVFDADKLNAEKEPGLTVDDHFAKALGETWTKLQATTRSKQST